jgi:dipeptidyl aminopeptidase/acylaminoacyl peptidase
MARYLGIIVLVFLFACQQGDQQKTSLEGIGRTPELESDRMTPEVLWSFGRLGEPSVSPDGTEVVYTVTYYKKDENRGYRDIYVIPSGGGESRQITVTPENEFNVVWRPDGEKIGYLSSRSGSTQLWEINPDGTHPRQITDMEGGISGFKYSPTLDKILYVKSVQVDSTVQDRYPDLPLAHARMEEDLMYRHWDTWHDGTYSHIFVADYSPKHGKITEGKDIMEGERYDSPDKPFGGMEQIDWHPGGKEIAYTCKKKTGKEYAVSTNTDIYFYNLETGETRNFTKGLEGYDRNPLYSPDGVYLVWEHMDRDGYEADKNCLYLTHLEKGGFLDLTLDFDSDVHSLSWSRTSYRSIFFISNDKGTDEIYRTNVYTGEILKVTSGVHDFQYAERATEKLVAQKVSMSRPAELVIVDIFTGEEEPLTHINDGLMDQLTMGKVEERWIETTDGKEMHTWIIYPPHFDSTKTYPALLYNQGGPQGTVSQFWSYRWNFQIMAAHDYVVVAPNRRGVPGFGSEWKEQISTDYGGQNIQDLLTAIDVLSEEPWIDENRLGAVGASYGGFSVFYLAGNHEGRFKAFIAHDGIFNLEHMYATTDEMWFVNWDQGGAFWDLDNEVAQRSYAFSPHRYVQKWDTPILVIHGGKDYRVPEDQGMAAFNSAILKGVPAKWLYFPEENHWVLKPQNGILWQRVFFEWLDKWLKE